MGQFWEHRYIHRIATTGNPDLLGTMSYLFKIEHKEGRSFAQDVSAHVDRSGSESGLTPGVYLCRDQDNSTGIGLLFHITEAGQFVQGVAISPPNPSVTRWPPKGFPRL
jgi:hypothetical protein